MAKIDNITEQSCVYFIDQFLDRLQIELLEKW